METAYLENEHVCVGVKRVGAELCSFRKKDPDLEYIWQADRAFWNRHAPVLFPIVGKLPQNQYLHQGTTYTLPQHGFARDQPFSLVEQTPDRLVYELTHTDQTLAVYPFRFRLRISYTLQDQTLAVNWQVTHRGEGDMFFSIGAHPAFNVPMLPNGSFEDYYLTFSQPETLARYLLDQEAGLFNGETQPVLDNMAVLPLRYQQYEKDAIVFKQFKSDRVTLSSDQHPHFVQMTFKGFSYLGIWTKKVGAPFLCLEPWYGLASSLGSPQELREKEGIQTLPAGETFEAEYSIAIG